MGDLIALEKQFTSHVFENLGPEKYKEDLQEITELDFTNMVRREDFLKKEIARNKPEGKKLELLCNEALDIRDRYHPYMVPR